jgi:MFS superfamily sulfate permease-like transporter
MTRPKANTFFFNFSMFKNFKANVLQDASAGFVIFLLALPLSLGIAKASEVPPIMGLITAIIGGLLVSFFSGSRLTIKGPAAGLIVIVAGSVEAFGGGVVGWELALGAMFVSGVLQILFGVLKLGRFVDFFPLAAVHGMLAAIGIIIIAKQIPVLLNVPPEFYNGMSPMTLFKHIPMFFINWNPIVTGLGIICLLIMLLWPLVKQPFLQKIPASVLVLLISIPFGIYFNFHHLDDFTLVSVGNILDSFAVHVDFSGVSTTGIFIKFVIMFALVGSLESLLTVKAIDFMDPKKRTSDSNKDLIAIGIGNTFAAIFGGIPMISEVARSSANVDNGAKTQWSNFFHAFFLLFFAITAYSVLEMIPNTALAAMLIAVGFNLTHPKHWIENYKIGPEQLLIFTVTIFVTLLEDLLVGVASGIILKLVFHIIRGASIKYLFKNKLEVEQDDDEYTLKIHNSAVFSNYLGIKSELSAIPRGKSIRVIFEKDCNLIDHSVMDNLMNFKRNYERLGGRLVFDGLEEFTPFSKHELAGRNRRS